MLKPLRRLALQLALYRLFTAAADHLAHFFVLHGYTVILRLRKFFGDMVARTPRRTSTAVTMS